jgi:hypothetical protein
MTSPLSDDATEDLTLVRPAAPAAVVERAAAQEIAALRLAVLTLASRFNLASNDPLLIQNHMEAAAVELLRLQAHSPVLDRAIHLLDHWARQVGPDAGLDVASPDVVRGYLRDLRTGMAALG